MAAGSTCSGELAKRVRLRDVDAANQNPVLGLLQVDGFADESVPAVAPGAEVGLRVEFGEDTPETYEEPRTGRSLTERMVVNFYATAGELGPREFLADPSPDTSWTAPEVPQTVHLFVVVRDGRGGLTVRERTVLVSPR